jgi:teichuronic acid biosynthesis glycosyltransferase TuaG
MNSFANNFVSVVTPSFNGGKYLNRLIESVNLQNFPLEHIVVDDCSTDNSWDILVELSSKYEWLKIFRLDKNSGPIVARNTAIRLSKGRFLAFLDVDDFWMPNKLTIQISFMLQYDVALCYTDYRFVSENGDLVGRRIRGFNKIGWNLHHVTRFLGCLTIVVDRFKISDFSIPDISPAFRAEDFYAWSLSIRKGFHFIRCPFDLARYSIVDNSRSSKPFLVAFSVWKLYRNVESIPFIKTSFFFISYSIFTFLKRIWFRPIYKREKIDTNSDWSILK